MNNQYRVGEPLSLRVPVSPEKDFYKAEKEIENIDKIDAMCLESLQVASASLTAALKREEKEKKAKDTKISLLKYLIRRATRTTPFGLFSGVGLCQYTDKTDLYMSSENNEKYARIDMDWLYRYIDKMIEKEELLFELRVRINTSCYVNGDRLLNPAYGAGGKADKDAKIYSSIRFTPPVNFIWKQAVSFVLVTDLSKQLVNEFHAPENKINGFLKELIKNEYLLLEIYPPTLNTESEKYVLSMLKQTKNGIEEAFFLENLTKKIKRYNVTALGDGMHIYEEIISMMKEKVESKSYLQVDLKAGLKGKGISYKVCEELEKLADFLMELQPLDATAPHLKKYKEDFLEKYGYCTEVPLMEMLDNVRGIGIPESYTQSRKEWKYQKTQSNESESIVTFLENRALEAVMEKKNEISLWKEDFKKVRNKVTPQKKQQLLSFDLVATLLANNEEDIDNGNFRLCISGFKASSGAMNTLGRFAHLFFGESKYDNPILKQEQKILGDDFIIAELSEQPRSGSYANINKNICSADYQIVFGTNPCPDKKEIMIDDIYIGLDASGNQFYAKSKKSGKRIHARTTHMMNYMYGSAAYRFLREISSISEKFQITEALMLFQNSKLSYFPRITYGKCILSPERWMLGEELLRNVELESWKEKLKLWKEKWNVPQYVEYIEGDNVLRLDLSKEIHAEILYGYAKKAEKIILSEVLAQGNNLWLRDEKGDKYCCEFVFPFIKNMEKEAETNHRLVSSPFPEIAVKPEKVRFQDEQARNLFSGEKGWYYYKLYGMDDRMEEFIGDTLNAFTQMLEDQNVIKKHFFIRYMDERSHIRARFQVEDGMNDIFLQNVSRWLIEQQNRGIVGDSSLCIYEREIERYGGNKLIASAENCFAADSKLVELLMKERYGRTSDITDEMIGIWSISGIMKSFGISMEEQEQWMSLKIKQNEEREIFRKKEKEYRASLFLESTVVGERIYRAFLERNKEVECYAKKMDEIANTDGLTNSKEEVLSSLIHMFCNRYMADNIWERNVRILTRHSLHSQIQFEKYLQAR